MQGHTAAPVQQGVISEDKPNLRVWLQRRPSNLDLLLDGSPSLATAFYAVEVTGLDIDAVETEADNLRTALHGYFGPMGTTHVLGAFANDLEEDYIPRSLNADEGFHLEGFELQIIF